MPEGDTIFRAARALHAALAGRRVVLFETALAKLARVNDDAPIVGRMIERVESRGKWCLIWFSPGSREEEPVALVTHMLMSGSWHLYRTGERWRAPRRAMRVVLGAESTGSDSGWQAVAFNVPVADFHTARSLARSTQVPQLGPDLLSAEFTQPAGVQRFETYACEQPEAEVGVVLLNQRVLAGLGNVYKSEVAFAAGINPWRAMRSLSRSDTERLIQFAVRFMKANVEEGKGDGIVTYTGNRRTTARMDRRQRLWVYGRQGEPCRRCGAAIHMRKQGVQARSTYWCPECQPWFGEGPAPIGNNVPPARRKRISC
jgi:endonuclease-8